MKNFLFFLLLIFFSIFFQSSALNILAIGHIKPDLVLIVACYIGLHWEEETGTCLGFTLGLLQDVFSTGILGLNSFSKTLSGYLCGKASKRLNIKNIIIQVIIIFIFSIVEGILFLSILNIFHLQKKVHETFFQLILPQTIYNFLITPFLFRIIDFFHKKWAV